MNIIPAIDIRGGKVVRLAQGSYADEMVYTGSPLETAHKWDSFGVALIHVVDLDGAKEGKPKNLAVVKEIAGAVRAKIELGGGIRNEADIEAALAAGVNKVVIGTAALDEVFLRNVSKKFGGSIVAGLDAKNGTVRTEGWVSKTDIKAADLVKKIEASGIKRINYTDISKDGMMSGPNIEEIKKLLKSTGMEVVASGGVSSIEDVKRLKSISDHRLVGVIIGKALYEGAIDLREAIRVCSVS